MKILTVTLNPAVDTRYEVETLKQNGVNRVKNKVMSPGGKGLNVSNVLRKLGVDIIATGFLGGERGKYIKTRLDKREIIYDFQKIDGETRTCIAIIDKNKKITEILENGQEVTEGEKNAFIEKYEDLLEQVEIVAISGSLPRGLEKTFYKMIIEKAVVKGKKIFLDTSGESLKEGIKGNPYLIKPNVDEMEYLLNKKIESIDEVISYSKKLVENGISNVMVTLGEKGGILVNKDFVYRGDIPKVEIKNTVGSGDASIAGFIYGLSKSLSSEENFKYALACGTSNVMLENTGDIVIEDVMELINKIEIKNESLYNL